MKLLRIMIIAWAPTLLSCETYLDIKPKTEVTGRDIFQDPASINSFVLGIYTHLDFITSYIHPYNGLYTDELVLTPNSASTYAGFSLNDLDVENTTVQALWQQLYSTIYKCNDVLEQLTVNEHPDPQAMNTYLAEAKFMRAYSYLTLVGYFGGAPLLTATDPAISSLMERISEEAVFELIIEDLEYAKTHLPEAIMLESTRPNKFATSALLARAYLYLKKYALVETECDAILSGDLYQLEDIDQTFAKKSRETLFQVWNSNGYKLGLTYTPLAGSIPPCSFSNGFYAAFDDSDLRKQLWTKSMVLNDHLYVYPYKYRKRAPADEAADEYTVEIRLAEIYLMRAEAKLLLGNVADAVKDLNKIRARAGLQPLDTDSDESSLMAALRDERKLELFCEWGHRFFDLKRFGQLDEIMNEKQENWEPFKRLFPIPNRERLVNPNLSQNPGYQQ